MNKHKRTSRLASRLTSLVLSILLAVLTLLPATAFAETTTGSDPFQGEILFPFNEGNGSTSSALSGDLTATLDNYVWDQNGRGATPAISNDQTGKNGITIDYGTPFANVNDLTMGVWVKPSAPNSGQTSSLMAPPYGGTTGNWGFSNGEIWWSINWGTSANNFADTSISLLSYGSDGSEWNGGISAPAGNLADGNWHYVAFSLSATAKTIALYVDGNQIGEKDYSSLYPVNLQAYKWFGGNGYQDKSYTGLLDELSVFPSVLDDTSHAALYNRAPNTSSGGNPSDPGDPFQGEILFPFNEGNGSTSSAISGDLTATLNNYEWDIDHNGRGDTSAISNDQTGQNGLAIDYGTEFANVNDLTMGVWVKPSAPTPGSSSYLMAPPYAGTTGNWGLNAGEIWWNIGWGTSENNYDDTTLNFTSYGSDGSEWGSSLSAPAGNLADGNWHYVAFSFSATAKTVALYLDGSQIGEKTYTSTFPVNLQAYKWFGGAGYNGSAYTGLLDELSVFPSVLGDTAHAALFNRAPNTSDGGNSGDPFQGEILFPFNEGNGSTSSALSDGLTATLTNYIWDIDHSGRGDTSAISTDSRGASGLTIDYGARFANVNDLTMGVWVKPSAPSPGTSSSLMAPPYGGSDGSWGLHNGEVWWSIGWGTSENNYTDTKINFLSYGSDGSAWDSSISAPAGNLADGNWHYLSFSFSATAKTVALYADGSLIGGKTYTSTFPVNLQAYKWFGGGGYNESAYTGVLDELSVFTSVLDDTKHAALYNRAPNTDGTGQQTDPADTDQVGDKTYHVAKTGSDSNPGTEAEPFLTIQKAADVLLPGETVIVHEGVYEESVRPKYNGTADHPITYKTVDGENVVISGANLITEPWQTASNPSAVQFNANDANLWKVDVSLPMGNYRNQIFVDGEAMLPSRYPNVAKEDAYYRPNWLTYVFDGENGSTGGWSTPTGKLRDPEMNQPAGTWDGAAIVGMDNRGWNLSGAEVVSSTPGWLNLANMNFYELGPTGYASGNDFHYYIQNAIAALDAPYEWYYNQNSETLYLQLPNGMNPNDLDVRYKAREWGLDLSSRKYIHIEGIDLNGCSLTMRNGVSNVVDHMTAKYVTEFLSPDNERGGIIVGGKNNTLINSEIAYSAGALVTVEGEGNKIVNSKLHDATTGPTLFTFSITISGINHLISHNQIYNASGTLIGGSFYASEISYNDIHDGNWHSTDAGLMYFAYNDFGNSQIHHNKIHDSHSEFSNGVYFDLGCKNALVYGNVFWNLPWAAVFINSSSEFISVVNNTVYNGATSHSNPEIYTNSPGDAYMDVFMNNVVDSRGVGTDNVNVGAVVLDNYSRPNDDLDGTATFNNPSALDFTLKSGSGAVGMGAYQPGDTWTAGLKGTPVTAEEVSSGPQFLPYANRNLLFNSGFEWPRVDFPSMGSMPYWAKTGTGSASIVKAGSSADNAHARDQNAVELTGQNIGLEQEITGLEPGVEYVLRGFARMGNGSSAEGQKVEIGVNVGATTLKDELDRPAWRSVSIKFTADETGAATVYAKKTTSGSRALVDDFSVVRADVTPDGGPVSDDLYPMLNSPVALLDDMLYEDSEWTAANQSSFVKDETSGLTLAAQAGQSAVAFYTQEKYSNKDFYLKLDESEDLDALDLNIILRATAATRTANRYEIDIQGTTATLTRYYNGSDLQLGQWTVDINDRLLKAGAVWDDVNESGYGGVTVTLKSGNETLFSVRDENNLNVSAPGYFGLATESSIKLGRVTEYVDMGAVIADKDNWQSRGTSINWANNNKELTPVGAGTAGYTGRKFGDAEFVVGFESGMNTGAFPNFTLRAPTDVDLLNNPWSGTKYSVIFKEGSFEIQHWPELWKPGASILSDDGRSALADNKGFVPAYTNTLVKISIVNTDYGVWIRVKAGDTIVASWIDENNYLPNEGYLGICGYTEPMTISAPSESTYIPVDIGNPDDKPGNVSVDTSALQQLIAEGEALVEAEYTEASWAALETALDNAKVIVTNIAATQAQIDAAATALQAAISDLVEAETPADIAVTGIIVTGASSIDALGETAQMSATVTPENATDKSVSWTVVGADGDATNKATIDQNGLLTAVAEGVVKVVATAKDGSGVTGESLVTIDTMPPKIVAPSDLSFLQTEAVSIAFSAIDSGSGLQSLTVSFNGKTTSGTVSVNPLGLAVGTYPIVVTATDNFGHQATLTFSLEITIEVAQLDELITLGETGSLIADAKTAKSLQSDIEKIQKEQAKGKLDANDFKQLEKNINKEKGKKIDAAFADQLLQSIEALKSSL
ncbi:LamG-like jellyroll fold domain-containing protein [Paenibacillus lignilyticus]|uniref:Ig-like domain-containing protein n=1 Tax=Paenibacillus lignilyticus TaxID=1172615 RepID=A0ABS5CE75_9BACL|nr:LamG-like jellyroll fold domain-containing protein [Paenibacillus lignilyticus]MBP3964294.1 Ig-like domain-containing protein [Paenibacillus lignilyticus]